MKLRAFAVKLLRRTASVIERISFEKKQFDLYSSVNIHPSSQFNFNRLSWKSGCSLDSWAICWYLSTFMLGGLTLFPVCSLVENIGFDGSGTHCGKTKNFDGGISNNKVTYFPEHCVEDTKATKLVFEYLNGVKSSQIGLMARAYRKAQEIIKNAKK